MATEPLIYYRQYLNDPLAVKPEATPQAVPEVDPTDINVNYYRRYLVDPKQVG